MFKSGSKHIETITEADEEEEHEEPEGDISKAKIDSHLRSGLEKWQRAMEETEYDMKQESVSIRSRNNISESPPTKLDPDGMRIVRGACISSEFRQRSYTDPTDLLWVFRRRCSIMVDENDNIKCNRDKSSGNWSGKKDARHLVDISTVVYEGVPEGLQKSSTDSLSSREEKHSNRQSKCLSLSSDSDHRDMEDGKTAVDRPPVSRKISAPACRMGRRTSQVQIQQHTQRRSSVSAMPRRMGRRGSEVPALTTLARRRSTLTPAYPVGLKLRGSRGFSNAEFHLNNIQTKAKHEMLANLVLPAFTEPSYRGRAERRVTCGCHPATTRTKKDEKRFQVTNEILETEKKYLTCLNTLKKIFEDPMREGNLLSPKEIDIIFPNELGHIRDSHTHFMKELEERIQNWKQYGIVGDIFTKLSSSYHIDVLKIYSDYVNNFPKAMAIINKSSRSSQKFKRFLQACSMDPECEGLDLAAYLLTPIQRLPRYVLLLRQLSKSTEASHPDSFHLDKALEKMKNMINILNDSIQNSCRIVNVSISRKSTKRRSSRKRPGLKELKITKEDNDRSKSSQGKSTPDTGNPKSPTSPTSVDSLQNSPTASTASNTQDPRSSPGPESQHNVLTRVKSGDTKSRPVSTGDLDRFYDTDHSKEFNAILEEGEGNDKSTGQSKFRIAAESVKRSWQRRSKKWRRSFEGKAGSTSTLSELGRDLGSPIDNSPERFQFSHSTSPLVSPSISFENTVISDNGDAQILEACNPLVRRESNDDVPSSPLPSPALSTDDIVESGFEVDRSNETENVTHDVTTIKETEELIMSSFPDEGSPYLTHRNFRRKCGDPCLTRPASAALTMTKSSVEEMEGAVGDKAKSDNDLLMSSDNKTRGSQCEAPESIWVPRQRPGLQKRSCSDGVRQEYIKRKLSNASCDRALGSSTSRAGSLDTSKDSLNDSGVSGTPDNSPINTLNKNVTKSLSSADKTALNMEKFKQLSLEERLGFDEVIASGFGENERKLKSEEELDKLREGAKSKKKFKDVVKQIFAKKKRKSVSSLEDALQAKRSSKILTRRRSFNSKDSKGVMSTV